MFFCVCLFFSVSSCLFLAHAQSHHMVSQPFLFPVTTRAREKNLLSSEKGERKALHSSTPPPPPQLMKPFAHAHTQPPHYADLQSVPMYKAEGISSLISTHRLLIRNRNFKSMRSSFFLSRFQGDHSQWCLRLPPVPTGSPTKPAQCYVCGTRMDCFLCPQPGRARSVLRAWHPYASRVPH